MQPHYLLCSFALPRLKKTFSFFLFHMKITFKRDCVNFLYPPFVQQQDCIRLLLNYRCVILLSEFITNANQSFFFVDIILTKTYEANHFNSEELSLNPQ